MMNKIYKVIWNAALQCWVAVSELGKAKGKTKSKKVLSAAAVMAVSAVGVSTNVEAAVNYATGTTYGNGMAIGSSSYANTNAAAYGHGANARALEDVAIGYKTISGAPVSGSTSHSSTQASVAVGTYANATHVATTAIGAHANAINNFATAVGAGALANKENGSAFGQGAMATGVYATALGKGALAKQDYSVALGKEAAANTQLTTSIGSKTNATGFSAIAIGSGHVPATGTVVIEDIQGAQATADDSMAVGASALANKEGATALGKLSKATNNNAVAVGPDSVASGSWATATGASANASGQASAAFGESATASGKTSIATGSHASASGENAIASGKNAKALASNTIAIGADANATANAAGSLAIGRGAVVNATDATVVGPAAQANGANATAVGRGAAANGTESAALGRGATATGNQSVALGQGAQATVDSGVALGNGAVANRAARDRNTIVINTADPSKTAGLSDNNNGGDANTVYAPVRLVDAPGALEAIKNTINGNKGAVSVGDSGNTRQIINVAAGSADSDAVNVAQLKAVAGGIKRYSVTSPDGSITVTNPTPGSDPQNFQIKMNTTAVQDAAQWYVKEGNERSGTAVRGGNTVSFNDSSTVDVQHNNKNFTFNVKSGDVTANTNTGAITAPTDGNVLAKAKNVAEAIQRSGWELQANGTKVGLVNPGDKVNIKAGTGVTITPTNEANGISTLTISAAQQNYSWKLKEDSQTAAQALNVTNNTAVSLKGENYLNITNRNGGNFAFKTVTADVGMNTATGATNQATATGLTTNKAVADAIAKSGFQLKENGRLKNVVNPGESLNFKPGQGTTVSVGTNGDVQVNANVADIQAGNNVTVTKGNNGVVTINAKDTNTQASVANGTGLTLTESNNSNGTKKYTLGVNVDNNTIKVENGKLVANLSGVTDTNTQSTVEAKANNFVTVDGSTKNTNGTTKYQVGVTTGDVAVTEATGAVTAISAATGVATNKTVADAIAKSGFQLQENGTLRNVVNPGEILNFKPGKGTTVSVGKNGDVQINANVAGITAGKNITTNTDTNGNVTINAKDTSAHVQAANNAAVKVDKAATTRTENNADITDYTVDLTDQTKTNITHGVNANETVTNKGLTFNGNTGSTGIKKLGSEVDVKGNTSNNVITTTANTNGITVDYNGTAAAQVTSLTYKANNANAKSVTLAKGLDFTNGTQTTAVVEDNGVVKFNVNTTTLSNATGNGNIQVPTGANSDGLVTAKNVANAINTSGWNLQANNASVGLINPSDKVSFDAGNGVTVTSTNEANGVSHIKVAAKVDGSTITVNDQGQLVANLSGAVNTQASVSNATSSPITIATTQNTNGTNNYAVDVNVDGKTITKEGGVLKAVIPSVETVTLTVNTTGNNAGKVEAPTTEADKKKLVTAENVAKAINESYWVAKRGDSVTTNADSGDGDSNVAAGNNVTFVAGKNMALQKAGNKFIYATKDDVTFNNVTANNTTTTNLTVNKGGNVDMGGNQVHNVSTGTAPTDAVNVKQLYDTVSGNVSTESVIKKAGEDNIAEVTVADNKQSGDKNAKYEVSVSKAKIKALANETVKVNTSTAANNPITVTPHTENGNTTYTVNFDGAKAASEIPLTYKANDGAGKTVKLSEGLNFKNGTQTTAEVGDNGVVKFNVNTTTLSNTTANGKITVPDGNGLVTAKEVANAINAASWNLNVGGATVQNVKAGDFVNFTNGNGTTVTYKDGAVRVNANVTDVVSANGNATITRDPNTGIVTVNAKDTNTQVTVANATSSPITIATTQNTNGTNNYTVDVNVDGKTITKEGGVLKAVIPSVETVTLTVNTTGNNAGKVEAPTTEADKKKLVTAENVAKAINESYWVAKRGDSVTTNADSGDGDSNVAAGNNVTFVAGKNMALQKAGNKFIYATKDDVTFNNVTANNTTTTNLTVNKGGNVDMGGNQVHNVSTGTAPTDAVNVKQLYDTVSGNVSTESVIKKAGEDNIAEVTVADNKQSGDKNAKYEVSVSKAKIKALANETVKVNTSTAANNPITVTPHTENGNTTYSVNFNGENASKVIPLSYKANDGEAKTVTLSEGLNFKNGTQTTAEVGDNGVVKFNVNTTTLSNTTANGKITVPDGNGLVTAKEVANAINAASWNLNVGGATVQNVKAGDFVNFTNGNGTTVTYKDGAVRVNANVTDVVSANGNATITRDPNTGIVTVNAKDTNTQASVKNGSGITVTPSTNANGTANYTVAVNVDGSTITVNNDGKLVANVPDTSKVSLTNNAGKVGDVSAEDANKLVTGDNLAKTINATYWKASQGTHEENTSEETTGAVSSEIKPGDELTFVSGKNMALKKEGNKFVYATKDDVTFNNVTANNTTTTNLTVNKGGNVDMGGNQVHNVSTGTAPTDAVNVKQLYDTVSGNVSTESVIKKAGEDNIAEVTVADNKQSGDKNAKYEVSVSKAKIKALANETVKVNTSTAANNPITVTPHTENGNTTYSVNFNGENASKVIPLSYKANDGEAKTVTLSEGLNFKNGTQTTAEVGDNGVVKFNVNTTTLSNTTANGKITVPDGNGLVTAKEVANAINAASWNLNVGGATVQNVKAGDFVNFTNGNGTTVTYKDGAVRVNANVTDVVSANGNATITRDPNTGIVTVNAKDTNTQASVKNGSGITVTPSTNANGTANYTVAVNVDGSTITVNNDGKLVANVPDTSKVSLTNNAGKVGDVSAEDANKLVTGDNLAKTINATYWKASQGTHEENTSEETTGAVSSEIKPGDELTFVSGKNMALKKDGNKFVYATKDDVTFNNVTTNNLTVKNGGNVDMGGNQVHNVANGTKGTDAVNLDQLNATTATANAGWVIKANGTNETTVKPNATVSLNNTDGNILITKSTTDNNVTFNFNPNATFGVVGKDGVDGSIGVNGKDGASVVINGKDGSIGLTGPKGKDGVSVTLKPEKGTTTVNEKDANKEIERIKYTANGTTREVATLDDGLKFAGDDNAVINRTLGSLLNITGGAEKATVADNIRVTNDGKNGLKVQLSNNVTFNANGSVKVGDTTVNNGGLTITGGPSITKDGGVNAGDKVISNVSTGVKDNDAVNVKQLKDTVADSVSTESVIKKADEDNIAEVTVADNKQSGDKNAKYEVSVSKAKIKALANETVKVNTSTAANNPITVTPHTENGNTTYSVNFNGENASKVIPLSYKANDGEAKTVTLSEGLNFKNGTQTTAEVAANGVVKFNVNTTALSNVTNNGKITVPEGNGLVTAKEVAEAINASYWKANAGGNVDGATVADNVTTGTEVFFAAGKNLKVKHSANNFTFSTADDVSFNNVTTNNLTVNAKGNVDMGGNQVHNVANGTKGTDAVNLDQLNATTATAKTEVKAGKNVSSVNESKDAKDGHTVYTIDAVDTSAHVKAAESNAAVKVEKAVTTRTDGNTTVTDYTVDLTDETKANITHGVNANTTVTTKGLTFNGNEGTTGIKKLGSEVDVKGGTANNVITTNATEAGITINYNGTEAAKVTHLTYKANGANAQSVNLTTGLDFTNGTQTTAEVAANGVVKFNVNTTALSNVTNNGKITVPEGNGLVTAKEVAEAINASYWKANAGGNVDGATVADNVTTGTEVFFAAGKNLKVKHSANNFTFSTADDVSFNNVTTNNLTVNAKGNVDMGGNQVHNVANGTKGTDAVNLDQLNATTATAKTEVKAGKNVSSVNESKDAKDGHTVYTIDAVDTSAHVKAAESNAAVKVEKAVTTRTDGNTTVTDYTVDLTDETKANITHGVNANTTVTTKGLTFNGNEGTTGIKKLGSEVDVKGGTANNVITTNATEAGITINYNGTEAAKVTHLTYKANGANAQSVNLTTGLDFTNGTQTTAEVAANGVVKFNVNTTALSNVTNNGKITVPEGNGLVTAKEVAEAINASYWKANAGGNVDGATVADNVTTGTEVFFAAGKNLKVKHSANNFTFSTADDVSFNNVTTNNLTVNAKGNVDMGGNQVHNVANGTKGTDAVNLDQLNATTATANAGWVIKANGTNATTVKPNATVSLNNTDGNILITKNTANNNVTFNFNPNATFGVVGKDGKDGVDGSIGVNGKDGASVVINGKDGSIGLTGSKGADGKDGVSLTLKPEKGTTTVNAKDDGKEIERIKYTANGTTREVATLDDGLKFKGDSKQVINRTLGSQMNITGGANETTLTDNNIGVVYDKATNGLKVKLAKDVNLTTNGSVVIGNTTLNNNGFTITNKADPSKTVSVTDKGLNNGGNTIINVAPGVNGTDAVNLDQLNATTAIANAGWVIKANGTNATTVKPNATVSLNNTDGNILITKNKTDNNVTFNFNPNATFGVVGKDGKDGVDGSIGVNGKDGSSVVINGKDGSIGLNGKDGKNGLSIKGDQGPAGVDGKDGETKTRIVYEYADPKDPNKTIRENVATLNDGLRFTGNNGVENAHRLNTLVTIVGEGVDKAASANFTSASGNINVKADGKGTLEVQLAKNLKNIETINNGNSTITLNKDGGTTISGGDVSVDGNKVTNVKDGDVSANSKDAVNGSQLYHVMTNATAGWNLSVNNGKDKGNVKPGAQVDLNNTDGNIIISKTANNVTFNFNPNATFGVKGKDGKDGVDGSIGVNGKDGASVVINGKDGSIGLTGPKGADGKDGASANMSVQKGTTTVNTDRDGGKDVTRIVYTDKDKDGKDIKREVATLDDGLKFKGDSKQVINRTLGSQMNITGGADSTKLTDNNIGVVYDEATNGLKVKLSKDVDLGKDGSITIGGTQVTNNGLTIKNGPSVTVNGVDAGNKKVTNVADGDINATSKDAVNGSQLYQAVNNINKNVNAAKTELEEGDNVTITSRVGNNGQTIYKVSSTDNSAHVQGGSDAVSVTKAETTRKDGSTTVTDYTVDLSSKTKDDIKKGVDAHDTVTNKGLTFNADKGTTGAKKLGSQVAVNGDNKNIETVADTNGVKVKLKDDINVNSVTANTFKAGDTIVNTKGVQVAAKDDRGNNTNVVINEKGINAGNTRIQNVAAGRADTDAVNVSQLKGAVTQIGNHINKMDKNLRAGIAGAMAAGGLYHATLPGKSMVAAGAGTYKGESAVAVGYSRLSDNGKVGIKFSVNTNTRGDSGAAASVGYQW